MICILEQQLPNYVHVSRKTKMDVSASRTDALAALREGAAEELDTSWLPDPEQRNLAVVLKLSIDALSDEARDCLLACAVCRECIALGFWDTGLKPMLLWRGIEAGFVEMPRA